MKKWILMLNLLTFMIVTAGCSTNSDWLAYIEQEPVNKDSALIISIKNGGNPVSDLDVIGIFEMTQMDHGVFEIPFVEQESGIYKAQLELPMLGEWISALTMSNGEETVHQIIEFDVPETEDSDAGDDSQSSTDEVEGAIALVNGEAILEADIEFYQFINHLQITMYREDDMQSSEEAELEEAREFWEAELNEANKLNTLVTQIIRLRAMALLALEKGHEATEEEVNNEVNKVRQEFSGSEAATEMIKQFGEEKFWDKQQTQYEMIVLVSYIQQDMIDKMKEENPDADMREVNFYAQKEYEELLVSQVESLEIEILIK